MTSDNDFCAALEHFGEHVIAQQLLGSWQSPFPSSWHQQPVDQSLGVDERLQLLLEELKAWVVLKAQETDEFEGEDLERLRGEAVGCMYAIRELQRHFHEHM